jgi:arabinogalactan endo-1,4-beta-galactosidase
MTTYGTRRAGKVAVLLTVLKSVGVNYVRPRIWNNPRSGYNVCDRLKAQGSAPDNVQIGNEINTGMLWSDGKACNGGTQVAIHTADADSDANARWFYDGIRAQGVQWDKPVILAETAYPYTTANDDGTANVISSSQPCSGYAATLAGQAANFTAVQNTARGAGAIGIFYWEPTWYAVPGNGWDPADINISGDAWENRAVFDRTGRLNPNIRWTA